MTADAPLVVCAVCGRAIAYSDGARCWVVLNQALPPACRDPRTGDTVRGHTPA